MKLISAIICTYNRSTFLGHAIESLLNQSLNKDKYEIIIVDNNSTDNTREVVDSYICQFPEKIKYIFEPCQGLSYARNTGWKAAGGQFVYYLDDDGKASKDLLKIFINLFKRQGNVAAVGGKIIVEYDPKKPKWLPYFFERFYGEYTRGEKVVECEYVPGGNSAWSKSFLQETGGFDTELGRVGNDGAGCEESELNIRAHQLGYKKFYSPYAIMFHHAGRDRLNLKWLLFRMKGQGNSSAKLIVRKVKSRKKIVSIIIRELICIPKILFKPKVKELGILKELVARLAYSVEKLYKSKALLSNLFVKTMGWNK